jgi:hypothetical protein
MRTSLLLVLLLAACSAPNTMAGPAAARPGPWTEEELRALLERYSPTGAWIARQRAELPTEFTTPGGGKVTLSSNASLMAYVTEPGEDNLVDQLDTAVHEVNHAITTRLGYQLLAGGDDGDGVMGVYVDGAPVLVRLTKVFPARELDATFPREARTSRYKTYIAPSDPGYGTQLEGVYSLLDELNSYYHGARTTLDLWPWVREQSPAVIEEYLVDIERLAEPYVEFRLYILHYLEVARALHPKVFAAVVGNESFRRGYAACVDGWERLLADARARRREIDAAARARGVDARVEGDDLRVGHTLHQIATPELRASAALLAGRALSTGRLVDATPTGRCLRFADGATGAGFFLSFGRGGVLRLG